MTCFTIIGSPLGDITATAENGFITGIWLPTQPGMDLTSIARKDDEPVLIEVRQWLVRYFTGERLSCDIPMAPVGTVFQRKVWEMLREIPYGEAITYGELAARFPGGRMSSQAVGQAVGRNPISILIPCHRVLGKNRKLTGYTGGLEIKTFLLDLESIQYR